MPKRKGCGAHLAAEELSRSTRFARIHLRWKALALFVLAATLAAQNGGILRGVLTDSSGAVVPSATVTLTAADKLQRNATTQPDGSYSFLGLVAGQYTVHVDFPGFAAFDKPVTIEPSRTVQFPIRLT